MEHYVGLDVSLKLTAICIVDRTGKIVREGVVPSDPEAIATFIKSHAPHVARIGLETGATATWLWTELNTLGLPVICIDARHAKAALKMQINKSDRNDAVGIARSCIERLSEMTLDFFSTLGKSKLYRELLEYTIAHLPIEGTQIRGPQFKYAVRKWRHSMIEGVRYCLCPA
jgi:hypothetical protein